MAAPGPGTRTPPACSRSPAATARPYQTVKTPKTESGRHGDRSSKTENRKGSAQSRSLTRNKARPTPGQCQSPKEAQVGSEQLEPRTALPYHPAPPATTWGGRLEKPPEPGSLGSAAGKGGTMLILDSKTQPPITSGCKDTEQETHHCGEGGHRAGSAPQGSPASCRHTPLGTESSR